MPKYHLKEDGNPGICTAKKKCPLGKDVPHFDNLDSCRRYYENKQTSKLLDSVKKDVRIEKSENPSYTIPAWGIAEAKARIEKANRRLARAGIQERFELTAGEPYLKTYITEFGFEKTEKLVNFSLNVPSISYKGWEFVATVDNLEKGVIVRTVPGVDLDGYRPEEKRCDHCGIKRDRNDTYLVRFEDGTIKQVGSSCLKDFLSVRPAGLWAIGLDPVASIDDDLKAEKFIGIRRDGDLVDNKLIAAVSMVITENGKKYVKSSELNSTVDQVRDVIWGSSVYNEDTKRYRRMVLDQARELIDSGKIDEVLDLGKKINWNKDFQENMNVAVANERNGYRNAGIIAYTARNWAEQQEKKAEAATNNHKQGFLAPVKTKIKDLVVSSGKKGIPVIVEKIRTYNTDFGLTAKVIMRTEDGQALVWNSSQGTPHYEQTDLSIPTTYMETGDKIYLTGGTVSEHMNYQGNDQTKLTRVKFEKNLD